MYLIDLRAFSIFPPISYQNMRFFLRCLSPNPTQELHCLNMGLNKGFKFPMLQFSNKDESRGVQIQAEIAEK